MARLKAGDKETARGRLLKAAATHFAQQGFDTANVNAIAVAAGFAKGTIYNYFDTKAVLFAEVLSEACRRTVARYRAGEHDGPTREALRALAAADVAVLREQEPFMKVLIREAMSGRPDTYAAIVEHLAPFRNVAEEILKRGVARGEIIDSRPPRELALEFAGMLSLRYVQHWGSGGAWPSLDAIPDLVVTSFLDGAAPRARPGDAGSQ